MVRSYRLLLRSGVLIAAWLSAAASAPAVLNARDPESGAGVPGLIRLLEVHTNR